jgi:hypothetical protein
VTLHPLIELANDREVKQAKGFRAIAASLNGEVLEQKYQAEVANAPKRSEQGKKHLNVKTGRMPSGPQAGKDGRHLALALSAWTKVNGGGIELPNGDKLEIVDSTVPLRTAAPDKSKGDDDPNKGVEDIDLVGLLPDDRLAVIALKFVAPDATRGGAGDTPLRGLLAGLAQCAMTDANREVMRAEIQEATGRTTSEEAPALLLIASSRYWEICRKREAQKGAGWIRELERLGRETAEQIGVEVFFVSVDFDEDPAWDYAEEGPILKGAPDLGSAWESGAGKLKPKPKKRKINPADEIVEADLSRPPRGYVIFDSYEPGERIEHSKLGTGVVQSVAGTNKIAVLFGEDTKLLVHERPR